MAMFRDHVAVGAVLAAASVAVAHAHVPINNPGLLAALFTATVAASFLPDLDSDSGLPFYIVFGAFSVACGGLAFFFLLHGGENDWRKLVGIPLGVLLFAWYVLGSVFKKCTDHRGMFHSLPAMAIAGLCTFIIAEQLSLPSRESFYFAGSIAAGYLSHLVLDELYSGVRFDGVPFLPKNSSAGTATKLFGKSLFVNIVFYAVLISLGYIAQQAVA